MGCGWLIWQVLRALHGCPDGRGWVSHSKQCCLKAEACWRKGESRAGSRWDQDGSWLCFLTINVSVEAAEEKEAGTGQCRYCHACPCARLAASTAGAPCEGCRSAQDMLPILPAEARSLFTKKWITKGWEKINQKEICYSRERGIKIRHFFASPPCSTIYESPHKAKTMLGPEPGQSTPLSLSVLESFLRSFLILVHQHFPALLTAEL